MSIVVFVDTETTGLHPDIHKVWEVAAIRRDYAAGTRDVRVWQLPLPSDHRRDPVADAVNGFATRRWGADDQTPVPTFLDEFIAFTDGAVLAGAVVSFDEERLRRMAWLWNREPRWHYHLADVENIAVGYLSAYLSDPCAHMSAEQRADMLELVRPPWRSDDLAAALGCSIPEEERHTAMGDAAMAERMFEAVVRP